MELKITVITILILFLINSVFSLVYKNNMLNLVNASGDSYYSPIFSKDSRTEIDVIRVQEEEEDTADEEPVEINTNKPINYTYTQPVQTTPPEQPAPPPQDDTSPSPPPIEEPEVEEPSDDNGSTPLPDPFDELGGIGN